MFTELVQLEDEMAKLSPEEKTKLIAEIRDALNPKGFRKAVFFLREWGILAVIPTIIVALAIFAAAQFNAANTRLADEVRFQEKTNGRLNSIDKDLVSMRALLAASQPSRKLNQDAAKALLAEAKQKDGVPIPSDIVQQAGDSFVDAARTEPSAWRVVPDFLNYRSFLNASLPSPISNSKPIESTKEIDPAWGFKMPIDEASLKPSKTDFRLYFYPPAAPIKEAAALEALDQPAGGSFGPSFISFTAIPPIAITLDGFHMRNIVFKNVIVVYRGGPTRLEHVLFVDCDFRIMIGNSGGQLANAVLTSQFTSFRSPGT
jgi:hypothetical protein